MRSFCTLCSLVFLSFSLCHSQSEAPSKQFGFTGLPVIYPSTNSGLGSSGVKGYALYLNFGKSISEDFSTGIRPFFGTVQSSPGELGQRISAAGLNWYGRGHLDMNKSKLFLDVNAGFGRLWYGTGEANGWMFNYAIGPGADFHLGKHFYLEVLVQYLRMRNISYPDETTIGNTIIPSIGIQRFF